jgi:hypothetical protein
MGQRKLFMLLKKLPDAPTIEKGTIKNAQFWMSLMKWSEEEFAEKIKEGWFK